MFGAEKSTPAISTHALLYHDFHSRVFHSSEFSVPQIWSIWIPPFQRYLRPTGTKNSKWGKWRDHAHFKDGLSSVGWNLLCSTHVPNLKCFRLPATKKSRFEPALGNLGCNAQGSSRPMAQWKAHCRLPVSDDSTFFASSHGFGTIKRNLSQSAFSEGVVPWVT